MSGSNGTQPLRIIPLGGLGEIGLNCLVVEYGALPIYRYTYGRNDPTNSRDPLGLEPIDPLAPSPSDPIHPVNYWIFCFVFPERCQLNDSPFEIERPIVDETGGGGEGGSDFFVRNAAATYQFIKQFCIGKYCTCYYKLFCVFNSRASCGESDFIIVTNMGPSRCQRYVQQLSFYYKAFGIEGCVHVSWNYTPRPEVCA